MSERDLAALLAERDASVALPRLAASACEARTSVVPRAAGAPSLRTRVAAFLLDEESGNESIEHVMVLGWGVFPSLFIPGLMVRLMREYYLYEAVVFTSPFF